MVMVIPQSATSFWRLTIDGKEGKGNSSQSINLNSFERYLTSSQLKLRTIKYLSFFILPKSICMFLGCGKHNDKPSTSSNPKWTKNYNNYIIQQNLQLLSCKQNKCG